MNNYVKYQQDDVLMLRINDSKCMMKDWHNCAESNSNVKTITRKNVLDTNKKTSAILALGEVTGHSHQIDTCTDENKNTEIIQWYNSWNRNTNSAVGKVPEYIEVKDAPATVTHEEHNPVTLPEGIYRVRIVKEFDVFSERVMGVAD